MVVVLVHCHGERKKKLYFEFREIKKKEECEKLLKQNKRQKTQVGDFVVVG